MSVELRNPEEVFRNGVSPSMVKRFKLCEMNWYNYYIRQAKPEEGKNTDTLMGSAVHNFLARRYKEGQGIEEGIKQFKIDFPETAGDGKKTQELGVRILKYYDKKYPTESEPFKVLWVENLEKREGYQVDLPGCQAKLHFIPDMWVERKWGGIEVWDHKTSSQLGAKYFEKFLNDSQIYCLIYGTGKVIGQPVDGCMVNAVGFKSVVNDDSFLRYPLDVSIPQLKYHMDRFARVANRMIEKAMRDWRDPEKWEMTSDGTACTSYFRKCDYLEMCRYCDNTQFIESIKQRGQQPKEIVL